MLLYENLDRTGKTLCLPSNASPYSFPGGCRCRSNTDTVDQSTSAEALYRGSLTADQRLAFDRALVGEGTVAVTKVVLGQERTTTCTYSSDSCAAVGVAAAWGDLDTYLTATILQQVISNVLADAEIAASTSPDFTAALAAWSECVTAKGYPNGGDPLAFRTQFDLATAAETVEAAVADAECKADVGLLDRWVDAVAIEVVAIQPGTSLVASELRDLRESVVSRLTG